MSLWNSKAETILALVSSLVKIAVTRPNAIYERDAFHALIVENSESDARDFWSKRPVGYAFGLVLVEKDVAGECAKAGVLVEARDDRRVLLVNSGWLIAATDRYRWINEQAISYGRICRGCGCHEPNDSGYLFPLDPAERTSLEIYNGVQRLHTRRIYTHTLCRGIWGKWVAEAESLGSFEAAQKSDEAHGRTPTKGPLLRLRYQGNAGNADAQHFNSNEQGGGKVA